MAERGRRRTGRPRGRLRGPAAADAAGAPGRAVTPRAVAHPAGPAEVTRPGPASGDPMADDLIRRVMAAIDGWIRANGLTALPPHIAFEQALSILNAMDRSFPAGDRE